MKIGDTVSYVNVFNEKCAGKVLSVDSDRYDFVKLKRGYPY